MSARFQSNNYSAESTAELSGREPGTRPEAGIIISRPVRPLVLTDRRSCDLCTRYPFHLVGEPTPTPAVSVNEEIRARNCPVVLHSSKPEFDSFFIPSPLSPGRCFQFSFSLSTDAFVSHIWSANFTQVYLCFYIFNFYSFLIIFINHINGSIIIKPK